MGAVSWLELSGPISIIRSTLGYGNGACVGGYGKELGGGYAPALG